MPAWYLHLATKSSEQQVFDHTNLLQGGIITWRGREKTCWV